VKILLLIDLTRDIMAEALAARLLGEDLSVIVA